MSESSSVEHDLREALREAAGVEFLPERLRNLCFRAISAEAEARVDVICPICKHQGSHYVKLPDLKGQIDAVVKVLDAVQSRPAEQTSVQVEIGIRPIGEMTLAEIQEERRALAVRHPELLP